MLEYLNWTMSALAFFGTILNSRRNKWGQCIWILTNIYMCGLNFYYGINSIACLYIAYTILAIYGVFCWRNKEIKESNSINEKGLNLSLETIRENSDNVDAYELLKFFKNKRK